MVHPFITKPRLDKMKVKRSFILPFVFQFLHEKFNF